MDDLVATAGVKALDRAQLGLALAELGEPAFRTKQLVRWLYGRGADSYDVMTDLSAGLRSTLSDRLPLYPTRIAQRQVSSDGTRKYLVELGDGTLVETVGLPAGDRLTVCFSSQAGCAMGCAFCATGQGGFVRNLGPGEMVDQVSVVAGDFGHRVTNAVAMGQGEPFANYDATLGAMRFMNSPDGLEIGARHLTVSTCGLLPGIERFAGEPEQFTLAVSLHSAVQQTRDRLMPGVRGFSVAALRSTLLDYIDRSGGRRPTVEYALIDGINDTDAELAALGAFCEGMLVHVNLIPVNAVDGSGFARSSAARATEFERRLRVKGIEASVRVERGADIDAACGQLRQRHEPTG